MPTSNAARNKFLTELLSLQQDGKQAISAPTNWTSTRPLLEVETELDAITADLRDACLLGEANRVARWHFFIGSPGNGKSAAVGQLVRTLIESKGCSIVDDEGTDIGKLDRASVPYSLNVFEPGREFASVRIVQDASVVRNPYAADVDPSRDLLDTLRDSWADGVSLVVCTNRGVLEKAYRDTYLDPAYRQLAWHQAILKKLAERDDGPGLGTAPLRFDARKPVFESVVANSTFLDKRSLILQQRDILDRLILRAVEPANWEACASCDVAGMCPFRANRDWLADPQARGNVVLTLRRAEVLSSQVIVFREALAIISFLLAGCARDYKDVDPCGWVRRLAGRGDIFGLASRRVHMCLYATSSPRGLDSSEEICARQLEALRLLRDELTEARDPSARHLTTLLDDAAPSSDVGVLRLLGKGGVFSRLDAINGPLPGTFSDDWDGNYERIGKLPPPLATDLDRACLAAWSAFEAFAENMPSHAAEGIHWAIRRWSSQFTLHLGALAEGLALDGAEIDDFSDLLELLWKDKASRTIEERARLNELTQQVARLLNRGESPDGNGTTVSVAENAAVSGQWIETEMRPNIVASGASGSLTVAVAFGSAPGQTTLAAPMYLWLRQRARGTMDARCIPADLLSDAMDAKSRAVGKSRYAFEPNNVSLRVTGTDAIFEISRYDGDVDIHEPQP